MKFKSIDGHTIEYIRWHTGIRADIVIDSDIVVIINEAEAVNFIAGLRGIQQITVWEHEGQDTLIGKQDETISIKQKYINRHGGLSIKSVSLSQEDANKIADDIQYMIDNPNRMD